MAINHVRQACAALLLVGLAPALGGCDEPTAAMAATKVAPEVSVVTVRPQPRAVVRELPGRIAPTRVADVRTRVSGIVVERMFQQGTEVKAGDPLYRIDPKPFEVELQASEAALAKADGGIRSGGAARAAGSRRCTARRRCRKRRTKRPIGAMRQAEAEIGSRKADVARARLNLDYATIRAPIDGIVGAALVSEGALVVQNETTNLATIQQLDPIYADFTQSVYRDEQAAARVRERRTRPHIARRGQGPPRARRRHGLSAAGQAAVLGMPRSTPTPGR